ncbi:MFS transporter [Kitasatospora atroaurantiaca]|uniref:Sugar phosphate permease n=1 Tax=Kitasatospora atroaurantiaca TaxID=285545 RepID=A0A561EZZ1_9ACTN|nr:MFS transporter [Kitasatospora atroaurantiaca]TWE21180.1 sugar phosphate permease [Kitasatospora atroaurantiaca]
MSEAALPAHSERLRSWSMLALGTGGQTASCAVLYGLAYLIPALQRQYGLSLASAGLLVSCPVFGALVTLAGWGVVADRYGERAALTAGLLPAAALLGLAATAQHVRTLGVLLVLTGAAAAATISASGRLVIGWFPPDRRGVAMGVRQAAQPLGVGLAAAVLPPVARSAGAATGFLCCALLCGAAGLAVAALAVDPPRPRREPGELTRSPYGAAHLWRLHGAAALLCVPQFVVTGFALVFLIEARGWPAAVAGAVLAVGNLVGAGVRLLAGWWSDRIGSRVRPMRVLALATVADLMLLTVGAAWHSAVGTAALLAAAALTVSTNGLHNTAVAEYAGPFWAGRALGIHGVAQHAAIVLVPSLTGALIGAFGYTPAFAAAAAFPLVAAVLIPRHSLESGRH